MVGQAFFAYFFWRLKKVSRRKGETLSGRYRGNGYVLNQQELSASQCPTAISTWPDCGVTMSPKSMCFQAGFAPNRALKR